MKATSYTEPEKLETRVRLGLKERVINYDVTATEYGYEYQSVTLPLGRWDYATIVNALVSDRYPADVMQAVVNNYLADPEGEEAVEEMAQMQQWRKTAKEMAKSLLADESNENTSR